MRRAFDAEFAAAMDLAERRGGDQPVLAMLDAGSRPARAIHAALHDRPMSRKRLLPHSAGEVLAIERDRAIRLFRARAGIGGAAVANLIASPPTAPDLWQVGVIGDGLVVAGIARGRLRLASGALCDR